MNYAFDASLSYRLTPELEAEAVIQHVSRHVVDRENPPAVSWNAWGARLRYTSGSLISKGTRNSCTPRNRPSSTTRG